MPAKKTGCLRNFLAVLFTTIITPVLANVIAQDVKDWQQALETALEGKSETRVDWNRPTVESAARPPVSTSPLPSNARAAAEQPASYPIQTPPGRKFGEWHWAAGAWGQ